MIEGEQFPGFKVSPVDPARDLRPKFTVAPLPCDDYEDDDDEFDEDCAYCDGWGWTDCHCGGDLCVCRYNGEIPCYHCS